MFKAKLTFQGPCTFVTISEAHGPRTSSLSIMEHLEEWLCCLELSMLVAATFNVTLTVPPETPSDLIPWAQKIEFESCK